MHFEFSHELEFETRDDFFNYIKNDTYLTQNTSTPVCFGIGINKDENSGDWDIDIYFND